MIEPILHLRRELHQYPELSAKEADTAGRIVRFFTPLAADSIVEGLGGHGVAVVFGGKVAGPTILLRCELDAVPIQELSQRDYRSTRAGISHSCGHDGHMAILAAVGAELAASPPERGRVVLLFQPAEETGCGAAAVLHDPRFAAIRPDFAFALHNLPGVPLGQVIVRRGAFNCASRGMTIRLSGSTAHAAQPESGRSPARAMCRLIQGLSLLPPGIAEQGETAFATVVGAELGKKAFGTAPGEAEIWCTLRSESDATMARLVRFSEQLAAEHAGEDGLTVSIACQDVFAATINSESAVQRVREVVAPETLTFAERPFRWSEDFGLITASCEGALIGIGAGEELPALHNPQYDFPEALIPPAKALFLRLIQRCLTGGGSCEAMKNKGPSLPRFPLAVWMAIALLVIDDTSQLSLPGLI
ncbi:amidohydrolase [Desulfogranum mediterraneum]|uniref:amidohydrolase n=1 Tax=Desulfogranum mediterraneum TaxID=160661 RepID=UPI000427EC54|nr:amidohydrolase [Desulfogranum mediterraneum]